MLLLYPAALFTSWRDFRANLRPISLLAVGLVLFTTTVVGFLAHYFIADLPLAHEPRTDVSDIESRTKPWFAQSEHHADKERAAGHYAPVGRVD